MIEPRMIVKSMGDYDYSSNEKGTALRLNFNENFMGCSPRVLEALQNLEPEDVAQYPNWNEVEEKISQHIKVPKRQIILTNGADDAIRLVMETWIDKGDEIIIPIPTYDMFVFYAGLAEAKINKVSYEKDLSFPTQRVLAAINAQTKVVVLVSPNNPTGTVIAREDMVKIIEKAEANQAMVVVDEAYYPIYSESAQELMAKYKNVAIIRTFAKVFGIAGVRLGYIMANSDNAKLLRKVYSPYNVPSLSAICGVAALEDDKFVQSYLKKMKENREYLATELTKLGHKPYPSEANFLLIDFGDQCEEAYKKLTDAKILVRNKTKTPLLKNCLRITVGSREHCDRVLGVII
jgi:histidinol-phosphate aminotransferase